MGLDSVHLTNSDDVIVVSVSMETWMYFQRRGLGCDLFDAAQENRAAAYLEKHNVPFVFHGGCL